MVAVVTPIEIVTPPKRYPPVGHCIYCGTYTNSLFKEHIIAYGLAGDSLVLPKASCGTCAGKTRDWEIACLRHLWWPFRTRIGAPTRGKQPPQTFTVKQIKVTTTNDGSFISYDKKGETVVGPMEFPLMFMSYKLPPAGVLVGRDPSEVVNYEVVARINNEEFRKFAPADKDGLHVAPLNANAYGRMLAKISHAYAVAELGESAFKPSLRRFIRGRALKGSHWVGGDPMTPSDAPHLHDIRWRIVPVGNTPLVVVSLRLFAFFGGPQYDIVVGELMRPLNQLPFLQQPLYTIDVKTALPVGEFVQLDHGIRGTWT